MERVVFYEVACVGRPLLLLMLVVTAADAAAVTVDVVVVDVDVVATPLHFVIQYNRLCSLLGEVGSLLPPYILCIVAGSRPMNTSGNVCFQNLPTPVSLFP